MVLDGLGKEKIVEEIVAGSNKNKEEIEAMIEEKKRKFSGLLTDSGAAFMVAKELGLDLELDKGVIEEMGIAQLEPGMNNVDLTVRAMHIFSSKKFEKGGKKGIVRNLIVADKGGEIRLTLWHRDANRLDDEKVERGAALLLKNCYVTSFNEKKQLNLSYNGQMIINPKTWKGLPELKVQVFKLGELKKDMQNIDVFARIARIYEERDFEVEGRKGSVLNFLLSDGTAEIRAVAWNEMVAIVNKLNVGDLIKIEGAYTKEGLQVVELHLGWQARIIETPAGVELGQVDFGARRKRVNELAEGEIVEVKGTVVDLYKGKLHYLICPKCRKKVEQLEEKYVCNACGEVKEPAINLVAAVELDDGRGTVRCVLFGNNAEKVLGIGKDELKKKLKEKSPEQIVAEIKPKILGKEILVEGEPRKNKQTGEIEFIGRSILSLNPKAEADKLILEIA